MSYVYRRPFQTAQHRVARVARVEWQPQPLWVFDGVSDELFLTEYTGTVGYYSGAAATFDGIADPFILTENTGSIGVQVPSVVPMSESGARFILMQAGFVVTTMTSSSPYIAFGDVISTYPTGGTYAAYGSTVIMIVSIGTQAPGEHGAGYPVDWQGKRRKRRLEDQPNLHLKKVLDDVVAELYGELTEDEVPKEVQVKAAKLVKPFVKKTDKKLAIPPEAAVDWQALEKDAARVRQIIALWRKHELEVEIDAEDEYLLMMA